MEKKGRVALLTTILAASFGGGLLAGYLNDGQRHTDDARQVVQEAVKEETYVAEMSTFYVPESTERTTDHYEIRLSGDYIVVFEVYTDNTEREIERAEIEGEMLLASDREMLEEGINVTDFDEAMLKVEDFVS